MTYGNLMKLTNFSKNKLLQKVIYLFINLYLLSLLIFVTCKEVFTLDSNFISALGSILSAGATAFATFVAVILFKEWKKQARYLDCIKLIRKIKKEIQNYCDEVSKKRDFFSYQEYFISMARTKMMENNFEEHDVGIFSGQEKHDACANFLKSISSISITLEALIEVIDELSVYLDEDLSSLKELIREYNNNILEELQLAHTKLMQFIGGAGTLPDSTIQKTVDFNDLLLAQTILQVGYKMDKASLKSDAQEKFKKYLNGSNQEVTFSYDGVLSERKNEIITYIDQVRINYIE